MELKMDKLVETAWLFCIISLVITTLVVYLIKRFAPKQNREPRYKRKDLLTKNEYEFYQKLRIFAEKYNYQILSKIRLADIVEPEKTSNKREWYSDFSKIKSKHVDFAICNKDNLSILCLVELDDNSHKQKRRIERDKFVDSIYESVKIPIIHTKYYNRYVEEKLCSMLGILVESVQGSNKTNY